MVLELEKTFISMELPSPAKPSLCKHRALMRAGVIKVKNGL